MSTKRPFISPIGDLVDHSPTDGALRLTDHVIHCGPENALLRHVIQQLVDSQLEDSQEIDSTWTPLVLYGDHGSGKSLVAHSLSGLWSESEQGQPAPVITTAADLGRALRKTELSDDIDRFTRQMRSTCLLVIDDVQMLARKTNSQSWLTNLLDYRARNGYPTIVTADGPIANQKLSTRLKSRLSGGLSVRIALPLPSTRKDVILETVQSLGVTLSKEKLEGLIDATCGKPISGIQSLVATLTSDLDGSVVNPADQDPIDAELIQKLLRSTARRFGVKVADLKGPSRRKNTALARAVAMFLLRELTPISLAECGTHFRNRDHTTVRHACRKIRKLIPNDEQLRETIISICTALEAHPPSILFQRLDENCA